MTFPRPLPPSMLARVQRDEAFDAPEVATSEHETHGPPTPRMTMPELPPTRHDVRTAERVLEAAEGKKRVEERSGAPVELLKGSTPAELAGPLALKAMRLLERAMNDVDPRLQLEAARVAATISPKVTDLTAREISDPDPVKRVAALRAALASNDVVALAVEVASAPGPLRSALSVAGWRAPGED